MKRPLDDTLETKAKISPTKNTPTKRVWTEEEDKFLVEEVKKAESINWKRICKVQNKTFKLFRRTLKECEERWKILNSGLTLSEELLLLLALYRGSLGMFSSFVDGKVEIKSYIEKTMEKAAQMAVKHESIEGLTPLTQLQLLICADLALNPDKERVESSDAITKNQVPENCWLEMVQNLIRPKEKLNSEAFHKYIELVVTGIEEKIMYLTDADDGLSEIMHERKDNPSQGGEPYPQGTSLAYWMGHYAVLQAILQHRQPPPGFC